MTSSCAHCAVLDWFRSFGDVMSVTSVMPILSLTCSTPTPTLLLLVLMLAMVLHSWLPLTVMSSTCTRDEWKGHKRQGRIVNPRTSSTTSISSDYFRGPGWCTMAHVGLEPPHLGRVEPTAAVEAADSVDVVPEHRYTQGAGGRQHVGI